MKKNGMKAMVYSLLAVAMIGFSACENLNSDNNQVTYTTVLDVNTEGVSIINETNLKSVLTEEVVTEVSDEELLAHMKDEEKLARDVYNALYTQWNVAIFSNIANAEQKHLDAVMLLINTYTTLELEEGEAGTYDNEDFALLFDQLVTMGSESLEQAYTVGALIEELDIFDLASDLELTTNENIILVFENLMRGSRNHLRAFNSNLVLLGVTYEPQYLDQLTFDEIVNSPMEQGQRYARQNRGGNRYGGQGGNGSGDGTCNL